MRTILLMAAISLAPISTYAAPTAADDDLLIEGLEDLLDLGEPAPIEPQEQPDAGQPEGDDLGAEKENPLAAVHAGMQQARTIIARGAQPQAATPLQQQVVDTLDELIRQAEAACKKCNGGGEPKPKPQQQASKRSQTKPKPGQAQSKQAQPGGQQPGQAANSGLRSAERLGAADAKDARSRSTEAMMKDVWGQLPEQLREQMLESSTEEFLPEYRDEIEAYFEELAKERE